MAEARQKDTNESDMLASTVNLVFVESDVTALDQNVRVGALRKDKDQP